MSVGIRFEGIDVRFGGRPVLSAATATLPAGERTALIGPNGGGKTTLVRVLIGALRPEAGRVAFVDNAGREVPRPRIGYLSQRSTLSATAPVSGLDVVSLSLDPRPGFGVRAGRARRPLPPSAARACRRRPSRSRSAASPAGSGSGSSSPVPSRARRTSSSSTSPTRHSTPRG